tara:strand:- start:12413 stop:13750 length:1338 start_codon:yes stop_codon:yes gene_type:complete
MQPQRNLYDKVQKLQSYCINFKGINLITLSQIYVFELSLNRYKKNKILDLIKILSLDTYLKSILAFNLNAKKLNRNVKYMFVNDIYNRSMIKNIRQVEDSFKHPFVEIVCDKRVRASQSITLFRFFNGFKYLKSILEVINLCIVNFTVIREVSKEFGINKYLLFLNIIESVYIINCVEGLFLKLPNLKRILLNTDIHKTSKTINLIAQKRNIKTHVIQHGSTVLEYGYLPVSANVLFTWGELSNKWFIERGTNPEKLQITGTPKTDFLNTYPKLNIKSEKINSVLIVMNPIGDENINNFLKIIFESNLHSKYRINIKLHPGSIDNKDLIYKHFAQNDISIFKHENIHDLIYGSDVVISTTSTVGNEAIALYKPLIKVDIEGVDTVLEYEHFDCCNIISSSDELAETIANTQMLYDKHKNYDMFINKYFYKLDGKSIDRIINHLVL